MNQLNIPESNLKRIVVIGCGFAGLNLVKNLKNAPYQIVMIDKHNYHTFQPLLYQVATAGIEPDSIAQPIRNLYTGQKEFYYRMAIAEHIDSSNNILKTNIGDLPYDYLVIATGSKTNYFGNKAIEDASIPMKSIPEALNLRSIILQSFEAATLTDDIEERKRLMNFVIVGAGPTGVELSGAIAELKNNVLPKDYPELNFKRMSIYLLEGMDKVLPPMSDKASAKAQKYLEGMGVEVMLNTMVKDYDGVTVKTNKNELPASNLIWAAGVMGTIIDGLKEGEDHYKSRYLVDKHNRVGNHNNIFAIGDVASMVSEENPKGHPMLAQVAIQQGTLLAKNLKSLHQNTALKAFSYNDKGSMATIGRNKAVADLNFGTIGGFFGWVLWMAVHLFSLVGFRNKTVVFLNWVMNYFSYGSKIRLIVRPVDREKKETEILGVEDSPEHVDEIRD